MILECKLTEVMYLCFEIEDNLCVCVCEKGREGVDINIDFGPPGNL